MDMVFFYDMYIYINFVFAVTSFLFALLFVVLKRPDHPLLASYKIVLKMLTVLYFIMALAAFIDSLHQATTREMDMSMALDDSFISAAFAVLFISLAMVTIVDINYINRSKYKLRLFITVFMSALLVSSREFYWPIRIQNAVFYIYITGYFLHLAYAFYMVITSNIWARKSLDSFFAGQETRYLSWLMAGGLAASSTGAVIFLTVILPGWLSLFIQAVYAIIGLSIVAILYLNYPHIFSLFIPVLENPHFMAREQEIKSKLNGLDIGIIQARLDSLMKDQELFRNPEINLTDLSTRMDLSVHQISELINRHGNMNFRSYINRYRIAHVKQLLLEENEDSILEIALSSGFNSKTAFNTIFKNETGLTPRQWLNSQKISSEI